MAIQTIRCRETHFYGINNPNPKSDSFYMKTDRLREKYGPFLDIFQYVAVARPQDFKDPAG